MTNIVMLCRDRLRLTEQALDSLYANTKTEDFNLVIIDDQSADFRVQRLLQRFGERANATLLRIEISSHVLARAKNIGVAWSRETFGEGDWLMLSDNDVFFTAHWLEKLTDIASMGEDLGFKLYGGQVHPFHQPIADCSSGWGGLKEYRVLDGPSWLMRWRTWNSIGPLSSRCAPGPCQSEDAEWCARLCAMGGRIGAIHPHVIFHCGLTQTDGKDAPGRKEREKMIPPGVLAE